MYKKNQTNKSFSIIELLIVVAIIAIMTTIGIVSFSNKKQTNTLNQEVQKLVASIRAVQNRAISGEVIDNKIPYCYGLAIDKNNNQYIIFNDWDNDKKYDSNEKEKTNFLDKQNIFESASKRDICFSPPEPIMYADGQDNQIVSIVIKQAEREQSQTIKINQAGHIHVE